jgi:hypothetical protein
VLLALLRLLDHYDVAAAVFAEVLRHQLQLADNATTCLRRDGPDMWLFSHYLANVCMPFLERTVKPIVARIQDAGKLPIVDGPAAMGEEVNPKESLTSLASALFDAVQHNVELLPASVGSLIALVAEGISSRWSDKIPSKEKQQQIAVSSTMFLRLITPCIISPVAYNLGKSMPLGFFVLNLLTDPFQKFPASQSPRTIWPSRGTCKGSQMASKRNIPAWQCSPLECSTKHSLSRLLLVIRTSTQIRAWLCGLSGRTSSVL